MSLDNIIKFFETLGITMIIDGNGNISFCDKKTQEKMECFYTTYPLPMIPANEIDYDVTLEKIIWGGRVKAKSSSKVLMFGLTTPVIDRKRTNDVIIGRMEFADIKNGVVTNGCRVQFADGRDACVSVSTADNNRNVYETIMFSSGDVEFKKNGASGYFNESFEEGYGLNKDDMIEVLNSTYLLTDIADYYSPLFPNMKSSIEKASESKTI